MSIERLPEVSLALAAELLELALDVEARSQGLPDGSIVSKTIKLRKYWYLQSTGGGISTQRYLGPDSEELRRRLRTLEEKRAQFEPDRRRLQSLHDALVASGATPETPASTRVLELLAGAGFFRAGAVLVGTRAFGVLAARSGFRASALARTQDIDVEIDPGVALAFPRDAARDLPSLLEGEDGPFVPMPGIDPRRPSTSFRIRGRELRVDFLTPMRGRESEKPVVLRGMNIAATPLRSLEYLLEASGRAVAVGTRPVLVRVPHPGRFALHKLALCSRRVAESSTKSRKDRAQAAMLIEALLEDRPTDLEAAASALGRHRSLLRAARGEAARLEERLAEPVLALLSGARRP
jgi:hypothetical protein